MQVYEINEQGYYIKPIEIANDSELTSNLITIPPQNGLYKAKWTGKKWIETLTQIEIDALNHAPKEPTENETLMLALADLDAQRVQDKLETDLAIAELAETLIGGV